MERGGLAISSIGETGIGETRLANAFLDTVQARRGARCSRPPTRAKPAWPQRVAAYLGERLRDPRKAGPVAGQIARHLEPLTRDGRI